MITRVSVKNFKLHKSTAIEAAPLTVFIGPNNSGKSSVLQALMALRQAATRASDTLLSRAERRPTTFEQPFLFDPGQVIDIGDFGDVVRRGESQLEIGLGGRARSAHQAQTLDALADFEVQVRANRLTYHHGKIESPHGGEGKWEFASGIEPTISSIRFDGFVLRVRPTERFTLLDLSGIDYPPTFSVQQRQRMSDLAGCLIGLPSALLSSIHAIHPLRGFEEGSYPLTGSSTGAFERMVLTDRANAVVNLLAYNNELLDKVSDWLAELLQIRIRRRLIEPHRIALICYPTETKGQETFLTNEGTGASQLPFILLPIALTPPNETLFFCEPEAHLHPKLQSVLVSRLLQIAEKESRQFFIETHSEHILHGFLNAVAKKVISRDSLAIYYFEKVGGESIVRRLEVEKDGRILGGLPGFFDHSISELADYLEALKNA